MNPKWGVSVIKFARQAPLSLSLKLLECPSLLPHSVLSVCYLCNFTLDQAIVKCLPIVSISHLNWHDNFDIHNFRYTIFLLNPLSFRTDHCGGSHLSLDFQMLEQNISLSTLTIWWDFNNQREICKLLPIFGPFLEGGAIYSTYSTREGGPIKKKYKESIKSWIVQIKTIV